LKEVLLHDERFVSLTIGKTSKTSGLVGHPLKDIDLPDGVLIAMVRRGNHVYIPDGATYLEAGDSLTIIGDTTGLKALHERYDPT
jgi:APA family basic amino acid/polyamine antiporter